MPRSSLYAVFLTTEERKQLERLTRRYTSPYCDLEPRWSSSVPKADRTKRAAFAWNCRGRSSQSGESDSSTNASQAFRNGPGAAVPALFPPQVVVEVEALVCQLPKELENSPSHLTYDDIAEEAVPGALSLPSLGYRLAVADSNAFVRAVTVLGSGPEILTAEKAPRVLDLYHRTCNSTPLPARNYIIST